MKLRTKFQDEDFDLGEVVDVAMATNPDGGITLRGKANNGREITVYYKSLDELNEDWEDYKSDETKRYRLIKDLPTFNAGDEFYIAHTGALWYDGGGDDHKDDVCAYATQTLMKFPNILTDWFEPINDEDTSVLNKEPLIKDPKIRKAVRAWLAIQEQPIVEVAITCGKDNDGFLNYHLYGYIEEARISNGKAVKNNNLTAIVFGFRSLERMELDIHRDYTIAELCGEEE